MHARARRAGHTDVPGDIFAGAKMHARARRARARMARVKPQSGRRCKLQPWIRAEVIITINKLHAQESVLVKHPGLPSQANLPCRYQPPGSSRLWYTQNLSPRLVSIRQ